MHKRAAIPFRAAAKLATLFLVTALTLLAVSGPAVGGAPFQPDRNYLRDRMALDETQLAAFKYFWEDGSPHSGLAYEANYYWNPRPEVVGGTGFGVAALVTAVERGWVDRDAALARLLKIVRYLRDLELRQTLRGAFPHWLDGATGRPMPFDRADGGADIVETSFLMQGLLIARAYFNGPGKEEELRRIITGLWHDVDWNFFTDNGDSGLHWLWNPQNGFWGLKILGYNECLVTYVLALASPTHPIRRRVYDYWSSGTDYQGTVAFGYRIEASPRGGGPLFTSQYSFVGLDPRRLSDAFVKRGYYVRSLSQTLSNRGYCLWEAPTANRYAEDFWGLSAGMIPGGYAANSPANDHGVVTPGAVLGAMPFTPFYSLQVLRNFQGGLRKTAWGPYGPYDGASLRDNWVSDKYLAVDQLPLVGLIENYRSGLLWRLFMSDPDVRRGLAAAGLHEPDFSGLAEAAGADTAAEWPWPGYPFPEVVVALRKEGGGYVLDAHDLVRHPDSGLYTLPFWSRGGGECLFVLENQSGQEVYRSVLKAGKGRGYWSFPQFMIPDGKVLRLTLRQGGVEYYLPVRLQ